MTSGELLRVAADDGRTLVDAAQNGWDQPVPHCPDWDAAGLVRHTGGILVWMAAIVESGQRISRRSLDPPPEDAADLARWYLGALDRTLDVLGSADDRSQTWTFSSTGDQRVGWWCRRLAVEAAIHRWDAEEAVASVGGSLPRPLDGQVASAGVEEFVVEFLPGLLSQDGVHDLGGTLHLHATDGPTKWWIDLDAAGATLAERPEMDTAIRASRSDLLLWLTNREPPDNLDVLGSHTILDHWDQLAR
jgi:uncharacterized protein (TIGR03083 family)